MHRAQRAPRPRLTAAGVLSMLLAATALLAVRPNDTAAQIAPGQIGRDGFNLEPFGGVYFAGTPEFASGETVFELDNTRVLLGARAGYTTGVNLFVEGTYAYVPLRAMPAGGALRNVDTFIFTGALGYQVPVMETVRAFVLAGAGIHQWKPTGLNADNGFEVLVGGGLKAYVTPGLAVRADVRDHYVVAALTGLRAALNPTMEIDDEATHNIEISFSAALFFPVSRDSDGDRVLDRYDNCPGTPATARADAYGCPLDGDADGVADHEDRCPSTPLGLGVDARGCPLDADNDQVNDDVDRCPGTPLNVTVDADGCPLDHDGDGVFSGLDRCPNTPAGAEVDENGCPVDWDGDGVYAGLDRCPNTPREREVDEQGCSRVQAGLQAGRLVLSSIYFQSGSAALLPESRRVLDEVGWALQDMRDVRLEIQGHTDSVGSESVNRRLSQQRAQAVYEYLINAFRDLDPSRFEVQGYGESQPIASNGTASGRAMNRRVEFVVLESGGGGG